MHTAEATAWLAAPAATARDMFWDMTTWRRLWEPIERAEVTYQDPYQQEFIMTVDFEGGVRRVRTIRYRRPDGIELFSPEPPPMMTLHRGWWRFRERGEGTEVTAQRRYLLVDGYPDGEAFGVRFAGRLQSILDEFATAVAEAGVGSAGPARVGVPASVGAERSRA